MKEGAKNGWEASGSGPSRPEAFWNSSQRRSSADLAQQAIRGDYQQHIDGLRGLAVLPVVFYHLFMTLCPGGFIGVDVFFVISGYLICGGIVRDLQAGSFSMVSFYFRRIRRIFAAYLVVVIAVLAAGLALYHWARIVILAQTALFSAFFSTNVYFWLTTGYFRPHAYSNPLLHLWSLGVEEQFYIIIPLALLGLWKIGRKNIVAALAICFLASFACCLLLGKYGQSTTAFYMLPARGWELLAGALLSALPRARQSWRGQSLGWLGLGLLIFSYWGISTARTFNQGGTSVEVILPLCGSLGIGPFPGWATVPSIAGSVLLLRYGNFGAARWLLCSRPLVWIGKISYSLYLWHWPLIVLAGYLHYEQEFDGWTRVTILAVSFLAAWISWRWVEMPARLSRKFTVRSAFGFAGVGCAMLVVVTLVLISTDGLRLAWHRRANVYASAPNPLAGELRKILPGKVFQPPAYPAIDPHYFRALGQHGQAPTFCLIGDSEAEVLAPGLDAIAAAEGQAGLQLMARMHPYAEEGSQTPGQRLLEWIAAHPDIRDIYLVGRWMNHYEIYQGIPKLGDKGRIQPVDVPARVARAMEDNFRRTASWFARHGKRVFVFSCVPEYDYTPTDMMARSQIIPLHQPIEITLQDYMNRQALFFEIIERLARERMLLLIPLHSAFFAGGTSIYMGPTGVPYYRDGTHLTPEGACHAARAMAPLLWPGGVGGHKAARDRLETEN